MQVELFCPCCQLHFSTPLDAPGVDVLDQLTEEGPWLALGDGQTYEDAIAATLSDLGLDECPRCGAAGRVKEESLGRLTMEVLNTW